MWRARFKVPCCSMTPDTSDAIEDVEQQSVLLLLNSYGGGVNVSKEKQRAFTFPTGVELHSEVTAEENLQGVEEANAQPVRIAWCELCRVDCTSKEILEQHNNGKRHKKNLQKLQNMKITYEPVSEIQKDENSLVQGTEADVQSKIVATDSKVEVKEHDIQETKPRLKRKIKGGSRGGRGGKRMKPTGPPRPKVVIPLMCDLCNVKCDTQEVFNRHTAGKKHMTKVKRFEGHQAMYGPTAVQVLYPPNPLSQTLGPQTAYYGAPESYGAPPMVYIPPPQAQNPNPQLADAPLEFGTQKAVSEPQVANVSAGESYAGNGVQ
uniref:uncharacterized protein LOC122585757 isoform X2 n=1 Tax=Erigeron canadensis TaxID=72917 RepID=UPI001CB89E13|nr:uncharacterized protein LOC122585757 isoform X2 [Erigeron canadensis]